MSFKPSDVVAHFQAAMQTWGVDLPLSQADVKPVTAITAANLAQQMGATGPLWLSANNQVMLQAIKNMIGRCSIDPYESMLDISVYEGSEDPYRTLITAESEASSQHYIAVDATSDDSGYIWDLFKLLQVWSPVRLFVARTVEERRPMLEQRIEKIVLGYHSQIPHGHQVFSLVLPTSLKRVQSVNCYGWESGPNRMAPLTPAPLRVHP